MKLNSKLLLTLLILYIVVKIILGLVTSFFEQVDTLADNLFDSRNHAYENYINDAWE